MIAIQSTTTFNGPANLFTLLRVSRTWQIWKLSFKLFSLYVIYVWTQICLAHILVSSRQLQHCLPLSSLLSSFKHRNQNDEQGKPHCEWTTECLSQASWQCIDDGQFRTCCWSGTLSWGCCCRCRRRWCCCGCRLSWSCSSFIFFKRIRWREWLFLAFLLLCKP